MVLSELLTDLRRLSRVDMLYVIQVLVAELSKQEANLINDDKVSRKDAALARIRQRWEMLPIQSIDQVQMWKFQVLNEKD
ncbi:MAG: hypothetical protein ACK456_14620 [Pseudanabaenaceae cyanobacterium]|jgi:hypothetical protein